MGLEDFTPVGVSKLMANNRDAVKALGAMAAVASWAANSNKRTLTPKEVDPYSLSAFQAKIRDDGGRLAKNYYFNAKLYLTKYGNVDQTVSLFKLSVDKITVPGWRAKTQQGKIYGINYEIATELEQDPIWVTFNVDIRHKMGELFLNTIKTHMFSSDSFSPKYKDNVSFEMEIDVTDENFVPLYTYTFHNSIFKTLQQINMGQGNSEFTQITAEIVYESIDVKSMNTERLAAEANNDVKNKNNLSAGPFNVDISAVNQTVDMFKSIPDWFKGPTKI